MNLKKELERISLLKNENLEYLKKSDLPLALCGVAELGHAVMCFLKNNNVKIDFAVVDKEYWQPDMRFNDFEVLPLEDVLSSNPEVNIIVTFSSGKYIEKMLQLSKLKNVKKCLFFDVYPLFNFDFDFVDKSIGYFAETYNCLADDLSRQLMLEFMKAKNLTSANEIMKLNVPNELQYFPDFLRFSDKETFVDCGAYIGDTIQVFLGKTNNKFNKIFAFEPDSANAKKCKENIEKCGFGGKDKILLFGKGSWNETKTLYFDNKSTSGSSISKEGTTKIEVDSIDNVCQNEKASFIKMDVEGAELESLKGAETQIRENKPKLAICVYHKKEDLIAIPQYILSLNPDYKLYLRHYGPFCSELVLYAV